MDPTLLDVLLVLGFATRLTRLAVVDDIGEPLRVALVKVVPIRTVSWVHTLITCPFCIGFWLSAAVVASWLAWGSTILWQAVAAAFTVSYLAGHAVARLDLGDDA